MMRAAAWPGQRRRRGWAGLLGVAALVIALTDVVVLLRRPPSESPLVGRDQMQSAPVVAPPAVETLEQQLARVARGVAKVRHLRFTSVPTPTYLPPHELAARAARSVQDYTPEQADVDRRLLAALGAVAGDADLRAMLASALSQQVVGFYDPQTAELVVRAPAQDGRLGPLDEITLAHELEHLLADQTLGLPAQQNGEVPERGEDAAYAAHTLVEGDATLTMVLYASRALSVDDQRRLPEEQAQQAAHLADFAELPHFVQRGLTFPYEEGLKFVSALQRAGWSAVDAAYRRPPKSTLQILAPELYRSGQGAGTDPRDPGQLAGSWTRRAVMSFGAADLLFLFEAPGNNPARRLPDPFLAATSWRGGEVTVWTLGEQSAVGIALEGEAGLCEAVRAWYTAAFPEAVAIESPRDGASHAFDGPDQDATLFCSGHEVRIGLAPDLATATRLSR
ncbi:MAG: hypothetical protein M3N32_02850 [Actinomycetota bacterium]|nr:hypothetical protein [Actinomycetota bacterium]